MPYLLHNAVYLITILPPQRTSLDSDISVTGEVLVVSTVVKDLAVVRVWWDDVSWHRAVRDFAVICGWIQTCSNKQVILSSLVKWKLYAESVWCLSCYWTLNTLTFVSHNQIIWEISLTCEHNGHYMKCSVDGKTIAQNIPANVPFGSAIIPMTQ